MPEYSFRKYRPLSLRFWHWFNMIVILGLLATVVLRKTFLNWRSNAALIETKLGGAGTVVAPEFTKDIAVTMRDQMWEWHIYLGFALAALLLFRIFIALFIEKSCPGLSAFKSLCGIKNLPTEKKLKATHYSLVKLGYAALYLVIILMVVTGFIQYFESELGLSSNFVEVVEEVHELLMWFFVVFGFGHIVGVVIAENRQDPGIVSEMIHGGEREYTAND